MSIKKNVSSITSIQFLRAALLVIGLLSAVSVAAQSNTGCATLATSGDTFPLTLDTSVARSKGTDEWNNDVIKISVREPGLLVVSAEGPEVHGLVYAPDLTEGEPHLLAEKGIGSAGRILALAVEAGEYCLHIAPPAGASGSVRVRADLIGLTGPSPQ
jgi:hypothetical protein